MDHLMRSIIQGLSCLLTSCTLFAADSDFTPLFPKEGIPEGWVVRSWSDVGQPAKDSVWKVENGILHGSTPRGTWLVSEKEYSDFVLEFEWKLGEQGNSGCGMRFPPKGDPAFDGLELQMVDPRYYGEAKADPDQLTASLYLAVGPSEQVYRPLEWNKYQITCRGHQFTVVLNGKTVLDLDLSKETKQPKRHDGSLAPPLKDRPRKGHIGFQELSRGGTHVQIRNARIKVL